MDLVSAILKNALRDFGFNQAPLWRLAEGKDLVKVELTFHKNNKPTTGRKKGDTCRTAQSAPPAGEWPHQPRPASIQVLRQTPPPAETTIQVQPPATIQRTTLQTVTNAEGPIVTAPDEDENDMEYADDPLEEDCPDSLAKHYISKIVHEREDDGITHHIIYQLRHKVNREKHRKPAYVVIHSLRPDIAYFFKPESSKYYHEERWGTMDRVTNSYTKKNSTQTWDRTKKDYIQKLMNTRLVRHWLPKT